MHDFQEFIVFMTLGILALFFVLGVFITPIMYLDGTAKSEWLLKEQGIESPWYRAAFLPETIFTKADITIK